MYEFTNHKELLFVRSLVAGNSSNTTSMITLLKFTE